MSVYFVGGMSTGLIKIGKADNAKRRLMELQTGSPDELVLLAVIPGGRDEEQQLHDRFRETRRHGEWFAFSYDLWSLIEEHATDPLPPEFGEPSTIQDEWARVDYLARLWRRDNPGAHDLLEVVGDVGKAVRPYRPGIGPGTDEMKRTLRVCAGVALGWLLCVHDEDEAELTRRALRRMKREEQAA